MAQGTTETKRTQQPVPTGGLTDHQAQLADLADLVVNIAREIREYRQSAPGRIALTAVESNLMRFIDRHPGATSTQACARTGILRPNLSPALRSLREKGLVSVERDESDQRVLHLYPTAEADRNLAVLRADSAAQLEAALPEGADVAATIEMMAALEDGLVAARQARPRP